MSNPYQKEKTKKNILSGITTPLKTKKSVQNSAIETGKDLVIGVIGGGIIGAALGRASLVTGLIVTGIGHYMESKITSTIGFGMMASSGLPTPKKENLSGKSLGTIEEAKERVSNFNESLKQKLFLDKLPILSKKSDKTTQKSGDAVEKTNEEMGALGDSREHEKLLDQLEKEIEESATSFASATENDSVSGTNDGITSDNPSEEMIDPLI